MSLVIDSTKIEYLVFEGGGGKGYAYAPALLAMYRKMHRLPLDESHAGKLLLKDDEMIGTSGVNRWNDFCGFAGSSVGAIIAFLLAIGYTPHEIMVEFLGDGAKKKPLSFLNLLINESQHHVCASTPLKKIGNLLGFNFEIDESGSNAQGYTDLLIGLGWPGTTARLVASLALSLGTEAGALSGENIKFYLKQKLDEKSLPKQLTFMALYNLKGKNLAVYGSRMKRLSGDGGPRGVLFSKETTPNMDVLTAVFISMSLPGIFKPTKIDADKVKAILKGRGEDTQAAKYLPSDEVGGYYLDGGLRSNLPMVPVHEVLGWSYEKMLGLYVGVGTPEADGDPLIPFAPFCFSGYETVSEDVRQQLNLLELPLGGHLDTFSMGAVEDDTAKAIDKLAIEAVLKFWLEK